MSIQISSSLNVSGSLTVSNDIVGNLVGTSSYTYIAVTASYITSSAIVGSVPTSSYALTASFALNGGGGGAQVIVSSSAPSGSPSGTLWYDDTDLTLYVRYQDASGSTWWTPSFTGVIASAISASYVETASYVATAETASYVAGNSVKGNVTSSLSASFATNALTASYVANPSVLTKVTGNWTLAPGVNNVSFSVDQGSTYTMFVNGNIPNGIITWNATVTTSNSNVPVVGYQYGWYYTPGNALVLTSMPDQITGTNGSIANTPTSYALNTSNVFKFGITNNSATPQVVDWGYIKLS